MDSSEFCFKKEGNKIQHSFNSERIDKLSRIESNIKLRNINTACEIITEEKDNLRKRNKILKIADKHGWDTVKEYLDSPLADNKDDAVDLRAAISRATRRRNSRPYNRPDNQPGSNRGNSRLTQEVFFVDLANSVEQHSQEKTTSHAVSTATSQGILQETVRTEAMQQPQPHPAQENPRTEENYSKTTELEQVEYFCYSENYEKQSDEKIINVKGNLRKNSLFWKNTLLASDFIMNVVNFGYRIPFISTPTPIILKKQSFSFIT